MKMRWVLLALAAIVAIGCGINDRTTGTLELSFGFQPQRSIIGPPISMDVTTYTVSGAGPGSTSFGPLVVTGTTVVGNLVPGSWTITVDGKNAAGDIIGSGTGVANVLIGQTAGVRITVVEKAGAGSYKLDLSWTPDIVGDPIFVSTLKNFAGTTFAQPITIDEVACTGTGTVDPLQAGYYSQVCTLWDAPLGLDGSEVLSTGFAAIVRVVKGHQTVGTVGLHAVQGYGGLTIDFDLEMNDPLVLTPSQPFGPATVISGYTCDFSVTADVACTSLYYLRGQLVGTDSYTVDPADLFVGETYRLDVLSWSTDGKRANCGTWEITRQDPVARDFQIGVSVAAAPEGSFDIIVKQGGVAVETGYASVPAGGGPINWVSPTLAAGVYTVMITNNSSYNHCYSGDAWPGTPIVIPAPAFLWSF